MPSAPPVTQTVAARVPQPDSFKAQASADEARRLAAARGGSQANILSDLKSNDVGGVRPVLSPVKAVMLGQ